MCSTYSISTVASFLTGLFMIFSLLALSFAIYTDDWAHYGNCTVHVHQDCKLVYNHTDCEYTCHVRIPDQLLHATLICVLASMALVALASIIGIFVMFLANCCDERHTDRRSHGCMCVISVVLVLSGIACLTGCGILLEMFWEVDRFGVSLFSSLSAGGLLFVTSLVHICCYCKIKSEINHCQYELIRPVDTHANIDHCCHVPPAYSAINQVNYQDLLQQDRAHNQTNNREQTHPAAENDPLNTRYRFYQAYDNHQVNPVGRDHNVSENAQIVSNGS